MSGLSHSEPNEQNTVAADPLSSVSTSSITSNSTGSLVQDSELEANLDKALSGLDHNHEKPQGAGSSSNHISLDAVSNVRGLGNIAKEFTLLENVGKKGDVLDPGAGKNVVIGSGDSDVILAKNGGFNTITTGTGTDTIILGAETTNRVFDFDPSKDRFVIDTSSGLNLSNIVVAQGMNPGKAGIDQPLDSVNNALVIDKATNHVLASLTFVKSGTLSDQKFAELVPDAMNSLNNVKFDNVLQGNGKLTGSRKSDKITGGGGDDFLYVGDDGFRFKTAKGTGPGEFPFPNTSPGITKLDSELKNGVFRVNGTYQNFEGLPLFSDGVQEVAADAVIPNGADPKALIEGFLKVPNDSEGNPITGFHLHFSREGFADATVERYFSVTRTDDKSGTVSAEFELNAEEQAALLAGNFYGNMHSTKHPVGENRVEFNTVKFA